MSERSIVERPPLFTAPFRERRTRPQSVRHALGRLGLRAPARFVRRVLR